MPVDSLASKCYCPCQAPETISWWSDTCWDAQDVASCLLSAIPLWGCDWGAALPEGEHPCPQHGVGVQGQAGCCNPMGLIRPTGVYGCCPVRVLSRGCRQPRHFAVPVHTSRCCSASCSAVVGWYSVRVVQRAGCSSVWHGVPHARGPCCDGASPHGPTSYGQGTDMFCDDS